MKSAEEILKTKGIYPGFRSTYTYEGIVEAMHEFAALPVDGYREALEKKIEDYKYLLRWIPDLDVPELIIEEPSFVRGTKPTDEDFKWAQGVIDRHKKLLVEKPIVVQMNEQEYQEYKNWKG